MAIIKCPECGHDVSDRARICPHCGVAIAGQIIICPDCGEAIFKDAAECPNCHCPINSSNIDYERPDAPKPTIQSASASAKNETEKPRPKVKRSYTAIVVSLVMALIIVLLGLYFYQKTEQQNELRAYENALSSGEPSVLQNFLDVYAEAPKAHLDSIRFHLDKLKKIDLEWANAVESRSKKELQRYVELHPGNVHVNEALILIDSIDWHIALADNTMEGYQLYLDEHPTGSHIDESRDMLERLDAMKLKPEEREQVIQLFQRYFEALSQRSESQLLSTLSENMTSYMLKEDATPADAVRFMHKLFEEGDINQISFTLMNDLKVLKQSVDAEGEYVFLVTCSAEERIDRSNQELERFASYRVTSRVSSSLKILAINMQKNNQ